MTAWIFQCNPDYFDVDGLLATETREFLFSANQNSLQMLPGDKVYLWRSQGEKKSPRVS